MKTWNRWRKSNPEIRPNLNWAGLGGADLSGAELGGAYLYRADLNEADLSEADLSGANFRGATLNRAHLYRVNLKGAYLRELNLSGAAINEAVLSDANLRGAILSGANLNGAELCGADLRNANLVEVSLGGADLSDADLRGAKLYEADLTEARCERANFRKADLMLARLLGTNLNGATLTKARLWETQRAGWSIKGVICQSVYWDETGQELTTYRPGEFERLYAEKVKVLVRYPDGISPLEVVTLPALIQHLEASRPGCKLRFESIQEGPGGAVVTIVVEDADDIPLGQLEQIRASIQAEAERKARRFRKALESEKQSVLLLKGEVRALERTVDKFLSRPTIYLEGGDAIMGDEYNVGQAGAVGPNAHAHDMTFNQIGGNIEKAMDLSRLAGELATLREAMSREAAAAGHYIALGEVAKAEEAAKAKDSSKMAQSLKAAGKWALDVATKIGTSLATEAIKESMGMK